MAQRLDIDELLSQINIVDVVNEYVPLKKTGANYFGICPFHNDRNPSLCVNDSKQIFKCFVCGTGGNAVRFVQLYEKIAFPDALYKLADKYGIKYEKTVVNDEASKLSKDIKSLNKEAAKFYFAQLKESPVAIDYMKKRGISSETAMKFGLGYAPEDRSKLYDHFINSGVSKDLLLKAGLITENTRDGKTYYNDRFRGRLMFPIFNEYGDVVAFGGRIIDPESKMAKYINSQETPAYTKGRHLYGYNVARKTNEKKLLVVEGYMDCIALHQSGIDFAVASLGTALTKDQARLIKKNFSEVILAYDNDNAGMQATIRGMEILKAEGLTVKIFRLTGAKDADEYLKKHSREEFMKQLDASYSLIEYKMILLAESYPPGNNENKIKFIDGVRKALFDLPETDKYIYSRFAEEKYGKAYGFTKEIITLKPQTQKEDGDKRTVRRVVLSEEEKTPERSDNDKLKDIKEKTLIVTLAENPNAITKLKELNDDIFVLDENRDLFRELVDLYKNGQLSGPKSLLRGAASDNVLTKIMLDYNISPAQAETACREMIKKMRLEKINAEIALYTAKVAAAQGEEQKKYIALLSELSRKKKQIK